MASRQQIEQDAPEWAQRARRCFDAGTNKTVATLRRAGSPRISGTELVFSSDGKVTLGMMGGSMKLLDLRRNPPVPLWALTLDVAMPPTFGDLGQRGTDTGWIYERHPFSLAKDPTSFISHADASPI